LVLLLFPTLGALWKCRALGALWKCRTLGALWKCRTLGALWKCRTLGTLWKCRALGALWRCRTMSAGLPVVAEAGGELLEADALIFIRVKSVKDCSYALSISALQWRESGKFVCIETAVFTSNLGKFCFPSLLQGCPPGVPGSFPLFVGELSITIRIEFCNVCFTTFCPGGSASFLGSLALFLINSPIFVEIELLEHFRQLSVTEGPVTVSVGKANAKGQAGKG
jgi:hypothetical protein